jgi:dihydroorotase
MRIHIAKGRLLDPASGLDVAGDLWIAEGRILAVRTPPPGFTPDLVIDASERLVCPGFIDLCARFREPGFRHKATIASESGAAAGAGITTVCCPPDTNPVIDSPAVVELIHQRAEQSRKVRLLPIGALTHGLAGERLAEMYSLVQSGCVGVSNGSRPIRNTEVLRRAFEYAESHGIRVFFCPENADLRNDGVMHEGAVSTRLGLPAIPEAAETVALAEAILLIELTGARVHFGRISSARSLALIAEAKRSGLPVTADTGICHLHLTDADVNDYNANCHLIPPLRDARDREALRRAVAEGVLDAVCSDHQPHDADAKMAPFGETESGASTLETLFPLLLDLVDQGALDLRTAIARLTIRPAEILGLPAGRLAAGAPADVAIIDLRREWTLTEVTIRSAGKNSPFLGRRLKGWIDHTLLEGRTVHTLV